MKTVIRKGGRFQMSQNREVSRRKKPFAVPDKQSFRFRGLCKHYDDAGYVKHQQSGKCGCEHAL